MSGQEFSQEEGAVESNEAQEREQVTDSRELDQATNEPEALVESTRGFEEAEQVEASVTELVEAGNLAAKEADNDPVPLPGDTGGTSEGEEAGGRIAIKDDPPNPPQGSDEISATPITLPGQSVEDEGASPLPIPEPIDLEPAIDPTDLVGPTPPAELPVEDTAEELVEMKFKGEEEIIEPIPPTEMPPEVEMADDAGIVKQEEVDWKFYTPVPEQELEQTDRPPSEMPPEVETADDAGIVKQEEAVDFKFYKPVPAEERREQEGAPPGEMAEAIPINIPYPRPDIIDEASAESMDTPEITLDDAMEETQQPPSQMPENLDPSLEREIVKEESEQVDLKFFTPVPEEGVEQTGIPSAEGAQRIETDGENKMPALDGSSIIDSPLDKGFTKGVLDENEDEDNEEELQT